MMKFRSIVFSIVAGLVALAVALAGTVFILKPGPTGKIVMASGGSEGGFQDLAETYKKDLARYGVDLELRPEVQGTGTFKGLLPQYKSEFKKYDEKNSDIQAGFMKGGFASSMQGRYASEKQQVWHKRIIEDVRSLGRLFYEPLWVFVRADDPVKSLRDLKGRKIIIGAAANGTHSVSRHILEANGVDEKNSSLLDNEIVADGTLLLSHDADAAMVFLPAESPKIQQLLRNRQLKLMDFSAEADAYAIRFPALSKIVLRQGSVELSPDIPAADVTLLAASVALVVRADLDPSLETLLAHTVIANPKSGFDAKGEPILFYKAGEFPNANDPEYVVSPAVRQLHKSGELPILLRSTAEFLAMLGLPYWPAAFTFDHGSQAVLLIIPLLSILLPLFHYIPIFYKWGIRRRLLARYRQLTRLESSIGERPSAGQIAMKLQELDRIDNAVNGLSVPLPFTDQVYDLRGHIELVRRRLEQMTQTATSASAGR